MHALVIVRAFVLSRLDYCNGLLGGAPKSLLGQLSGVMRIAARPILVLLRQSHVISEIRARLHWLDMLSRVQFKLCCIAFRCLHGSAPPYLASYFIPVGSIEGRSQLLRSAAAGLFLVPRTWTVKIGPRHSQLFPLLPRGTVSQSIFLILAFNEETAHLLIQCCHLIGWSQYLFIINSFLVIP